MSKKVTIGIPAFKAQSHICDCLASIQIQTEIENIEIVIANDYPHDNYDFVKKRFPNLDITILDCEKNTGPGLARQRCLDAAQGAWITFIDADDVFVTPFAIEMLLRGTTQKNAVEVQATFLQEIKDERTEMRVSPRSDIGHPWVFGRLYNVKFLKENGIEFSELRAMEDGELNWKIRMTIEGSPFMIVKTDDPVYLWRIGSEHSITRIGVKENGGEPLYNWDLCQVGATAASINAIKFCRKKNPFNGNITRFTVEMMIGQYFTYVQCLERKPLFAKQNFFNAKRFYNECYKFIENQIDEKILKDMYTIQTAHHAGDMIGIIPAITFFDFMKKLKEEPFGGKAEFDEIREEFPDWVKELDMKSGVLGEEGYIYVLEEKRD